MAFTSPVTLHASGAETASGASAATDLVQKTALELALLVSARAGTAPTLAIAIETSKDGTTGWREVGTFDEFTETTELDEPIELVFEGCDKFVRAKWTITGAGASFTFTLSGVAVVIYATPTQFERYGLPKKATEGMDDPSTYEQRKGATGRIDRALVPAGYTLPLLKWGDDITRDCCAIAAYDVFVTRGVDPDTIDDWIRQRYVELVGEPGRKGELDKIADGKLVPPGIVDSTPETGPDATAIPGAGGFMSKPRRGWD